MIDCGSFIRHPFFSKEKKPGEVYHRVVKSDGVMGSKGGESVCTPGECLSEPVASDTDVFLSSLHVKVKFKLFERMETNESKSE